MRPDSGRVIPPFTVPSLAWRTMSEKFDSDLDGVPQILNYGPRQ